MRNGAPKKGEVRDYLTQLLVDIGKVPRDRIVPGACVDTDLRMESVVFIEIQVALEEHFNVEVDPLEMLELNEFTAIVDYLYAQIVAEPRR